MDEKEFKPIAKNIFREIFGLTLEDIIMKGKRTPDFIMSGERDLCLIELKIKGDDPAEMEAIIAELESGEVVSRETPAGRRNRLDGIIGDGVEQLASYEPNSKHFHVLWIHCAGRDPEFHRWRFTATIYGTQELFTIDDERPLITCYYFHNSSFFRYRDSLDGVILSVGSPVQLSVQLCVNSVSPQSEAFRRSELFEAFRKNKGLLDPTLYEGDMDFMIVDSDIDRHNHDEVLKYLKDKYGLNHLQSIDLKRLEGIISIKPPDESSNK